MKTFLIPAAASIAGTVLLLHAPLAAAHDRVNWSISIGTVYSGFFAASAVWAITGPSGYRWR